MCGSLRGGDGVARNDGKGGVYNEGGKLLVDLGKSWRNMSGCWSWQRSNSQGLENNNLGGRNPVDRYLRLYASADL